MKYVDDFTDILAATKPQTIFTSLQANRELLQQMASSVGLRLNSGKTQIIPMNIPVALYDKSFKYRAHADLPFRDENGVDTVPVDDDFEDAKSLGFKFCVKSRKRGADIISGDPAADALIGRLNAACKIITDLRTAESNVMVRLNAATKLVFSCCYDLGNNFVYISKPKFERIEVAIRKLLKNAGLDHTTPREVVYSLTTRMTPKFMAIKQIIQCGLKLINPKDLQETRYSIRPKGDDHLKPFKRCFYEQFNALPLELRKKICKVYDGTKRTKVMAVKRALKKHYREASFPDGIPSESKRFRLVNKHLFTFHN